LKESNLQLAHKLHHRKDVNDIVTRQHVLEEIIFNLKLDNISVTPKILLEKMKEKEYKIDRSTLYRDRLSINQRNSFLRDLSESNYSFYVENMWEDIELVTQGSQEMFITTKNPNIKNNAGKLILETVRTKIELFNSKALDISVELLGKKMRSLKKENTHLKYQLEKHPHDSE